MNTVKIIDGKRTLNGWALGRADRDTLNYHNYDLAGTTLTIRRMARHGQLHDVVIELETIGL